MPELYTTPSSSSSPPLQAELSIDFLVIGGSLSGLATAYALRRVGHRVLVVEERHDFFDETRAGGFRLPPNMSKVFYHWGLEKQVRELAMKSSSVAFRRMESGESLGEHVWEEEVLRETGGDFIFAHHADLRKFLYNQALEAGAKFKANSKVIDIDMETRSVKLESGEILTADVIVGADGFWGFTRKFLTDGPDTLVPTGMVMYNALVPAKDVSADPELSHLLGSAVQHVWFGHMSACLAYELGGTRDLGLHIYVPNADYHDKTQYEVPLVELQKDVRGADVQQVIRKLASLAKNIMRTPIYEAPGMQDWVHDDGPLIVIGEAAHQIPPGSIQSACMGVEDAAVLAKLFSHLLNRDQIPSFLYAFEDLRQARCEATRISEMGNIYFITLPNGEQQQGRDDAFRQKFVQGLSPLLDESAGTSGVWEGIKELFGYDAEDEADNWWVEWGALRERAKYQRVDTSLSIQARRVNSRCVL